ncbi:MAG TPA: hypothetical protein VFP68_13000 [Burkholderiaceae bacterium]|nr:hypothetical protein [Burkholderiaceae bacterium]
MRGPSVGAGSSDCVFPALGQARAGSLHVSPADSGLDGADIERLFFCALCVNGNE